MCERQTEKRFAKCKTKCDVIDVYMSQLESLRTIAQQTYAIDSPEFETYVRHKMQSHRQFRHRFRQCDTDDNALFGKTSLKNFATFVVQCVRSHLRRYFLSITVCAMVIVLVNYKTEASKAFMRNIQTFIYPVMRAWRKITLPLIIAFPALTELYDETCLIENPFFRVSDLDCTPCARVVNVIEHSAAHPRLYEYLDYSAPYIVQVNACFMPAATSSSNYQPFSLQTEPIDVITIPTLSSFYYENRQIFRQSAYKVRSTNADIGNLDQLFGHFLNKSTACNENGHHVWHINRMLPARILRKMFATPKYLPQNAGIGIDRYVIVDDASSESYELPTTDCSNMFVYQASGSRQIHLQPTKECHQHCRRISVRLKTNQTRESEVFFSQSMPPRLTDWLHSFIVSNSILRLVVLEASVCTQQICQNRINHVRRILLLETASMLTKNSIYLSKVVPVLFVRITKAIAKIQRRAKIPIVNFKWERNVWVLIRFLFCIVYLFDWIDRVKDRPIGAEIYLIYFIWNLFILIECIV